METQKCCVCGCRRNVEEFITKLKIVKSCLRCRENTKQWRLKNKENYTLYRLQQKDKIKVYRHEYYVKKITLKCIDTIT